MDHFSSDYLILSSNPHYTILGGSCFDAIAWIHVYSPVICHKGNAIATQHTKTYDTKLIYIILGGMLHG